MSDLHFENGKLVECDACVQNFLITDSYECSIYGHEQRTPTAHAIEAWESFCGQKWQGAS